MCLRLHDQMKYFKIKTLSHTPPHPSRKPSQTQLSLALFVPLNHPPLTGRCLITSTTCQQAWVTGARCGLPEETQ